MITSSDEEAILRSPEREAGASFLSVATPRNSLENIEEEDGVVTQSNSSSSKCGVETPTQISTNRETLYSYNINLDKHKSDSRRTRDLIKKARNMIKKGEEDRKNGIEKTEEQRENELWAEKTLLEMRGRDKTKSETPASDKIKPHQDNLKRNRSQTEEESERKKIRFEGPSKQPVTNLGRLPVSEVIKLDLKISIVDINAPDWRIPVEKFSLIEQSIFDMIMEASINGILTKPPQYDMSERFHGFRLISCDCMESLNFLQDVVKNLPVLWEGSKIVVKLLKELPAPPRAKIFIPLLKIDEQKTMKALELFNQDMSFVNWKIIKVGDTKNGRTLVIFRIDDGSVDILKMKNNFIFFNIRKIPVYVNQPESLEKALQEKPESLDEAMDEDGLTSEDEMDITPLLESTLTMDCEDGQFKKK